MKPAGPARVDRRLATILAADVAGNKADIVMHDLDHPNWLPFNDPVSQLVHTEDGTAVACVMIGGGASVLRRRANGSSPLMPTAGGSTTRSSRSSAATATATARGWSDLPSLRAGEKFDSTPQITRRIDHT